MPNDCLVRCSLCSMRASRLVPSLEQAPECGRMSNLLDGDDVAARGKVPAQRTVELGRWQREQPTHRRRASCSPPSASMHASPAMVIGRHMSRADCKVPRTTPDVDTPARTACSTPSLLSSADTGHQRDCTGGDSTVVAHLVGDPYRAARSPLASPAPSRHCRGPMP